MELGRKGKSPAQIRADLSITKNQWSSWIRTQPEFKEATEEAHSLELAFWEGIGQTGAMMGVRFNATAWIFAMKNRFRDFGYADKHDLDVKDTRPIELVISAAEAAL